MSLKAHRFHHLGITFRVFLSGESAKLETSGKYDFVLMDFASHFETYSWASEKCIAVVYKIQYNFVYWWYTKSAIVLLYKIVMTS